MDHKSNKRRELTPEVEKMLRANTPRSVICDTFKVSGGVVNRWRHELGLVRTFPVALPEEAILLLGVAHDKDIAIQFNVPVEAVGRARRVRGIPRTQLQGNGKVKKKIPKKVLPLIGKVPTAEIARQARVSHALVTRWTKELGVKTRFTPSDCPEEWKPLLGTMTDKALAEKAGVTHNRVFQWRHKEGVPSFHRYKTRPLVIPDGLAPLLGTMSDTDLAKKFRLKVSVVREIRVAKDIPRFKVVTDTMSLRTEARYPGLVARLGRISDTVLGREYDLSRGRIQQIREALGITAWQEVRRVRISGDIIPLLGTKPDTELAKEFGVPIHTVQNLRRDHRILLPRSKYSSQLEALKPFLGKRSDHSLAREFGVPPGAIHIFRVSLGIPPLKKSPASRDFKPLDREAIKKLYQKGLTDEEIATRLGSTEGSIGNIRCKMGLCEAKNPAWTQDEYDRLTKLFKKGLSDTDIGKSLGRTAEGVFRKRKFLGLWRPGSRK